MNLISRRAHGILDYLVGALLIFAPKLLGFDTGGPEETVTMGFGIAAIVYSLCTRYEFGLVRVLSFRVHLALDTVHALGLALSPWLFGFSEIVWAPHLILGIAELGVVLMTRREADATLDGGPATHG